MKVLHLSWSSSKGGAARAASRLSAALNCSGIESKILTANGISKSSGRLLPLRGIDRLLTRPSAKIDQFPLAQYPDRRRVLFSPAWAPDRITSRLGAVEADILHLHWVNNGFMRIETLADLQKPIVWTFHDMWPFTGGCHYDDGCNAFVEACGRCPQLTSEDSEDLSKRTWRRKLNSWKNARFTVVSPSSWLARAAADSSLLRNRPIEVIPNTIDTDVFSPCDSRLARAELGLPQDKIVLLFGALTGDGDKRKGFHFISALLAKLTETFDQSDIHLAVLGTNSIGGGQHLSFPVTCLGLIDDDRALARAYSAADMLVVPSIQDNLPNSVMEAGSCGVPTLAFAVGGLPDMVDHLSSGYLADPFDVDGLAAGVQWLARDLASGREAGRRARERVLQNYSYSLIARQHANLYARLIG